MQQEIGLKQLLEKARQQLTQPFAQTRRTLLILLNGSYLILTTLYLTSEKVATGHFVPHPILAWVYGSVGVFNLISLIYNWAVLRKNKSLSIGNNNIAILKTDQVDTITRWSSVVSIMIMSICHMTGVGNPSSDAILTDFALAHSLIVLAAILLGRPASFFWFCIVLGLLAYATFGQKGYDYQYNYLTPAESTRYEAALHDRQAWALTRQAELRASALNPPRVSRYFDTWLVFILMAFLTSYFCMGITLNVFKVIPTVTQDIKEAINTSSRQEIEQQRERSQAEEQRLKLLQENLQAELKALKAQINPHFLFNTLNYFYVKSNDEELSGAILKLAEIMRYSMQDNISWVKLDEEINYMHQFIDLNQLRNNHKLFIDFTVEGETASKQIPPFLFISLLENAFKHGKMIEADHPLFIRIEATQQEIKLLIRNQKNRKIRVASNNIGLTNLRQRLFLTYGSDQDFQDQQDEDYYSCQITIKT